MPGRQSHSVIQQKDGSIVLQYKPTETGIHELNLSHNDKPTEGTPFRCHVDNVKGGFVTAFGDGLGVAQSGQNSSFTVVGGGSKLDINIDGPSKVEVTKKEESNGVTQVSYMPMSPGEYNINIKANGKHIHGSPFSAKVSGGEGRKRSQLSIAATSDVPLGGKDVDLAGMVGTLKTPSGGSEPCLLKKMPDGKLGIASFSPQSKGKYSVDVKQDGKAYSGSPFVIDVGDAQVASANRVGVSGSLREGKANAWNVLKCDLSKAGYGGLALSIEGPHRCDIEQKDSANGSYSIQYKPHEPGVYLLNVRFGDNHVTGSPYMMSIGGEASGRVRETKNLKINPAETIGPGAKCEFQLKIPGTDPLEMEATLTSPSGKSELCEIRDLDKSLYDIRFVPAEEGVHTVSLKHRGLHIAGSPFQYTVGTPPNAGAYKVEIGGPGLEKGEVGDSNEFNIYTREAGGGDLSVAVEGPSKAQLEVVDRGHGYTTASYKVSKSGEYGVHVKYNGEHVPDSPSKVYVAPESGDAKHVTVQGLRDRGLELNKPTTFHVNMNGAQGHVVAHLDSPSGADQDIFLQELDRDLSAVRFTPTENGIYYVHLKLNEAHITGSPFPILVGKAGSDPALVLANGDGLTKAESGKAAKFTVVTTNAGTGMLSTQIDGPSKVAIQCLEVEEGYEFSYTPMAPGDYLITIKYCNVTIAGCPTKAKVTGEGGTSSGKPSGITESSSLAVETVEKKPGSVVKKRFHGDAKQVVAKGLGLKKGFFNRMANFTIDVKGAGNALLQVGIISPTGNPIEELNYKKTRPTQYQVNYKTKEKGEHTMHVRWGADDIPGSPFNITVG